MHPGAYFKTPFLILAFLAGVALRSFFNVPQNLVLVATGLAVGLAFFVVLAQILQGHAYSPAGELLCSGRRPAQGLAKLMPTPTQKKSSPSEVTAWGFLILAFLLGILRFSFFENNIAKDELHLHYGENLTLNGTVISGELKENSQKLVLETEKGRLLITKRIYPQYKYGDYLEVKGKILEPENFGDFDVKKYLAKSEIYAEMVFPEISLPQRQILEGHAYSPAGESLCSRRRAAQGLPKFTLSAKCLLFSAKDAFEENLRKILPEPAASLADGMLLGNQGTLDKDLMDDFRKSGTIHILVLSGYNITIVGVFVMAFFGFLVPEAIAWILAVIAITGFTLMSGGEAAAVRSAIMAVIGLVALRTGRKNFAIYALIFAAFVMVLWNPMLIRFDRGFQLSFLATLGLIVASPFFSNIFKFLPDFLGLKESAAASFSAQIFVLPLLLSWGGEISWLSPLANILIVGVVPMVMLFSFLGALGGFISVFLGKIIASAAFVLITYQIYLVKFFGSLGFSMMHFSFLPMFILIAIYSALFYWAFKTYVKVF